VDGVVAVELHPNRAALLRRRFPEITVVEADAVNVPLPGRPFRVVASPPYGITAGLLDRLLTAGPRLVAADLVLQRAVVRKQVDKQAARKYRMSTGLVLPRHAFRPPPRVDSAVLLIRRP
jgi:23S rRNA (adenine-N6)-dimethyltransferase